ANPEPDKETEIPKIDGKRPELVKTEDVPKENFVPLQPTPPPLPQSKEPQEEVKSATTYKPGDLTMAKPDPNPQKDEGKERQFRLHQDGNITDLDVVENTAGSVPGLLCETAVEKPKPYEKFPADMRRVVGDIRNIRFTFYYD